ncbi:MAG: HigA family addiction module antidote protein [Proteobacteria bacterium]|nr:HigA family addiction module antidote protein [Pseudomonadota bacterium]
MRIPAHPGKILEREIAARNMRANRLALDLGVPATRISEILRGRRGITPETALRLAAYFGGSPRFWMTMQTNHDIGPAQAERGKEVERTVRARPARA